MVRVRLRRRGFRAERCWALRAWQGDSDAADSRRQWYWETDEGFKAASDVRKVSAVDSVVCLHRVKDVNGNVVEAMEHVELKKWLQAGLLQLPDESGAFRFGGDGGDGWYDVQYLCGDAVQRMPVDQDYNKIVNGMAVRGCEGKRGRKQCAQHESGSSPCVKKQRCALVRRERTSSSSESDHEGVSNPAHVDLTDDEKDVTGWSKVLLPAGARKKKDWPRIYLERKAQVKDQICDDEEQRWALQPKSILATDDDELVFTDLGREQMEHMGVHAHEVGLKVQCHPRGSMALSLVARHKDFGDIVIFNDAGTRGSMKVAFEKGLLSKPDVPMNDLVVRAEELMGSLEGMERATKFLGIVQRVTTVGLYMQKKWESRHDLDTEVDLPVSSEICADVKTKVDELIADLIGDEKNDFARYDKVRAINDELKKIVGSVQDDPCLLQVVE